MQFEQTLAGRMMLFFFDDEAILLRHKVLSINSNEMFLSIRFYAFYLTKHTFIEQTSSSLTSFNRSLREMNSGASIFFLPKNHTEFYAIKTNRNWQWTIKIEFLEEGNVMGMGGMCGNNATDVGKRSAQLLRRKKN